MGNRVLGNPSSIPRHMPEHMKAVLEESRWSADVTGRILTGERLSPRESRWIYRLTWNELRNKGFSRPLRITPWPGVTMLLPFYRGYLAVTPQSFSERIPSRSRALAMVGRTRAALESGYRLVVVMAGWTDEVLDIMERGAVTACSPDRLNELLFSGANSSP